MTNEEKLKKALEELVGASSLEELEAMEDLLKEFAKADDNARLSLNAVRTLIDIYK